MARISIESLMLWKKRSIKLSSWPRRRFWGSKIFQVHPASLVLQIFSDVVKRRYPEKDKCCEPQLFESFPTPPRTTPSELACTSCGSRENTQNVTTDTFFYRLSCTAEKIGGKKYGDSVLDSMGKRVGECHDERFFAASR